MLNPDIIVNVNNTSKEWKKILTKCGYQYIKTILPPKQYYPTLFSHISPKFDIFIKTQLKIFPLELICDQWKQKPFEHNIMEIAHYIDIPQITRQLILTGKYFPEFKEPDLNKYYIKPVLLDFLADAYENANRLNDSAKTRRFILINFSNNRELVQRSELFFQKHPNLLVKYKGHFSKE